MKKKDYNNSLPPGFGMGVGRGQRRLAALLSPEGAVQGSARLFSPSAVWSHGQGPLGCQEVKPDCLLCRGFIYPVHSLLSYSLAGFT